MTMTVVNDTFTYQEAKTLLLSLKANGVDVSEALRTIKPRRMWRIFYSPAMSKPDVIQWQW